MLEKEPDVLTEELILRLILAWYASGDNWKNSLGIKSYSNKTLTPATLDEGKLAKRAVHAKNLGNLLVCFCDTYDISLGMVATLANLPQIRVSQIAANSDASNEELIVLKRVLTKVAKDKNVEIRRMSG